MLQRGHKKYKTTQSLHQLHQNRGADRDVAPRAADAGCARVEEPDREEAAESEPVDEADEEDAEEELESADRAELLPSGAA